jgi:RNA-directed DNA polymerase
MKDRAMQMLHLLALDPVIETTADANSYGFRPQRSAADAIEHCFKMLAPKRMAQWVLEGDIKSCFERINHDWLLAHAPMDRAILRKWLKAGFMEGGLFYPTEEGTPQGGPISPALANLTLDGLDRALRENFPRNANRAMVNLTRYADDFVITGRSREVLEEEVIPVVEAFLRTRGLDLSREKTKITHISDGFDFLGQNVRKYKGKLMIKPSKASIKAMLDKCRRVIKANKTTAAGRLIKELNPIIRGWANYHRHVCGKESFVKVDHAIFWALWRWAVRRHPRKPKSWIKEKYFGQDGGNSWMFKGEVINRSGEVFPITLFQAHLVPIRRHTKIASDANPYDPSWEAYFERRLDVKMEADLKGRRRLLYLWKEQGGLCPVCRQKITRLTGWHSHHITWRSKGGSDGTENRVLLHPNCHTQAHCRDIEVVKPRPVKGR